MDQMRCVFGIDVSRSSLNVAVVDNQNLVLEDKMALDLIGLTKLKELLDHYRDPEVIFEATGVYSRRLEHFLRQNEYHYVCLNPLAARIKMASFRPFKTDRNDARELAMIQAINPNRFTYQEDRVYQNLRDLHRFYQNVTTDVARNKNRLHKLLQLTFPEIERVLSTTSGQLYWTLVNQYPHPGLVKASSHEMIVQVITKAKTGPINATSLAEKLISLAQTAYPAVDVDSLRLEETRYLATELMKKTELKAKLIGQMVELAQSLPEFRAIMSIPGIAETTAVGIIAEFGDIRRFKSSNAMNSYVGIGFNHYESGQYVQRDTISKRGNAIARKILYKTVLNCVSVAHYRPNHLADFYNERKRRSPQPQTKKIAIATMHRLIRTIHHLVKNDQLYDYQIAKRIH